MAIATGLRKFISKATVTEKKEILPLLDEMIGNDKKYPLEWTYLNKGTHEESRKEEFDRTSVKSILSLLAQMDAII